MKTTFPPPSGSVHRTSQLSLFRDTVAAATGRRFSDYGTLHRWSVEEPSEFWKSVWDFDGIVSPTPYEAVLGSSAMPGARWFEGATVNYARQVLRHVDAADAAGQPAIIAEDERGAVETLDWSTLRSRVASVALALRALGVVRGDRVAAYLPNRPEAVVAFLACASIGAIWAVCAPDMGAPAILDRFGQIEPRVLIATDGVLYGGREMDRSQIVSELAEGLPSLEALVRVRSGYSATDIPGALEFSELVSSRGSAVEAFDPEWLPFDHPLWIVYSSGTTGKPKALVHGHGGILLGSASARIHSDLGASYEAMSFGERFHWFSSTGWMMWNSQVAGLLAGTTICIFDGNPAGHREKPDWGLLWRFAARNSVTFFGAGAQFYTLCSQMKLDFSAVGNLSSLRALGSTASPLPSGIQRSISRSLADAGRQDVWWFNSSGGTDIAGAFCTGNIELPETPGKLQCRQLGAAVEAWDGNGQSVTGTVGELVCIKPLPNMPLFLWGDADARRYKESYFEPFPGVWRQGDWLKVDAAGTCEIFGRSDATINRGGHRMGTSEIYSAVEKLDGVRDSLVIDVLQDNADSQLILFVETTEEGLVSEQLRDAISVAIRTSLSPRFVPDHVVSVSSIPRTLSSKKQELPIKRLFEGGKIEQVINPSTMANPDCIHDYASLAGKFQTGEPPFNSAKSY